MFCECVKAASVIRAKRYHFNRVQMKLSFPEESVPLPKIPIHRVSELERQPSNFPPGWTRLAEANPTGWREEYYARWIAKRIAAGLPHKINNPLPSLAPSSEGSKITSRHEGQRAGNAVPGQLCDPRRMKAWTAGGTRSAVCA
jgi:hypothetical protein